MFEIFGGATSQHISLPACLPNEDDLKKEDDLNNGDDLKNEDSLKNEDDLKMKTTIFFLA